MKHLLLVFLFGGSILISGCASKPSVGYSHQANEAFAQYEKDPIRYGATPEQQEHIKRVWSDVPEYAALHAEPGFYKKAPRMTFYVAPTPPPGVLFYKKKITILVSFVIDEQGRVEAARIVESQDSRFDRAVVDAVLKWKFSPAEFAGGPAKTISLVPVIFDGTNPR